jgi:hypothetical protein
MIRELTALCAAALGAAAAPQGIDGRVLEDHSGSPLASVEVRVHRIGVTRLIADLETEGDGRFHLPEPPAGEYRIDISKSNYIGATLSFRGPIPPTLLVRMVRCGVISGRIFDQLGQSVRGAVAYAMPKPADGGPLRPFAPQAPGSYSLADQQGQYRLFYLPPGQYAVAVSYGASSLALGMTGSAPVSPSVGSGVIVYPNSAQPQFFTVAGGEEYRDVDFNLPSAVFSTVSGKVEIPVDGQQSGRYWLTLSATDLPSLASASTVADADGTFRFEGIAAGSYNLFVSGPSNGRGSGGAILPTEPYYARNRVEVAGQPVEDLAVSPQKGQTVSFVMRGVQEARGACPQGALLTLSSMEDWAAALERSAQVSSAKEQVLRNLAPARYRVRLANLGDLCYQVSEVILNLAQARGSEPFAIQVAPAGSIHGKLRGPARPKEYVVALLASDPGSGEQAVLVAFPDAEARFTFSALRPGRYYLAAQPANAPKARWISDPARMMEIEIAGGSPKDLELLAPLAEEGGER